MHVRISCGQGDIGAKQRGKKDTCNKALQLWSPMNDMCLPEKEVVLIEPHSDGVRKDGDDGDDAKVEASDHQIHLLI
jgi:hypothetical protein